MNNDNRLVLTVKGKEYTVRWRGNNTPNNFTGERDKGYTGTINQYRLPHIHDTPEKLQFCAYECAIAGEDWMARTLGVPVDIEAFLRG
jgi:hypothetical protein